MATKFKRNVKLFTVLRLATLVIKFFIIFLFHNTFVRKLVLNTDVCKYKMIDVELFSNEVFRLLLIEFKTTCGMVNLPGKPVNNLPRSLVSSVVRISSCRLLFFKHFLDLQVICHSKTFSRSNIDFYLFLQDNVKNFYPHQEMSVFDKICMSVAFATKMCIFCSDVSTLSHVPLCWAMYFEKDLADQFYHDGGWESFEEYMIIYKLSNVFQSTHWNKHINFKNRCFDIKFWVEMEMKSYDLDYFRYSVDKLLHCCRGDAGKLSCKRCSPLIAAIFSVLYPDASSSTASMIVEGYLQLLLHMLSEEEKEQCRIYLAGTTRITSLGAIDEVFRQVKKPKLKQLPTKAGFKSFLTRIFFKRMFKGIFESYAHYNALDNSAKEIYYTKCFICAQDLNRSFKSTSLESEKVKLIKSAIHNTVDIISVEKSAKTIKTEQSAAEKSVGIHNFPALPEQNIRNEQTTWSEPVAQNEHDSPDKQTASGEKDALKLFLNIGMEPPKSIMVNF